MIYLLPVIPASILYKSIAGRYRPVRVADGPITARYRFIKNAYWECFLDKRLSTPTEQICFFTTMEAEGDGWHPVKHPE